MSTLNYTSTAGDAAFERALTTARAGRPEPLAHLVGGDWRPDGELFERADPCDPGRVVSRAHRLARGGRRRRGRRARGAARLGGRCTRRWWGPKTTS